MIWQFFKRDAAWGYAPMFAATLALASLFYNPRHQGSLIVAMAGPIFMVLFMRSAPHRRVTLFEAALPVSGRTLILARYLALLSLIWLPAAAMAVTLALRGHGDVAPGLLLGGIALTLVVTAILSVRPREFAAPVWLTFAGPMLVAMTIVPASMLKEPLFLAGALAIITVVWTAIAWQSVPEGFQSPVFRRATSRGNAAPAVGWWPLIPALASWQLAMFVSVGLLFVATGEWVFGPLYMMLAYSHMRTAGRWTMALPIPRRTMLTASALPLLLVLAIGTEIGIQTRVARELQNVVRLGDPQDFRATGALDVSVSPAFWRLASEGRVPAVRAPWGETRQPPAIHLLGGTFYNPYSVGVGNSLQFQDWQFARATSDIYGAAMSPMELAHAKPKPWPVTLQARMQVLTLGAVVAIALFWIWVTEAAQWHPLGRLPKKQRSLLTAGAVSLPLVGLLVVNFYVGPSGLIVAALQGGLLWVSRTLPQNMVAVVAAALVPAVVLWWAAIRQAAVAEVSQQVRDSQTLFDRMR
jgi:hypothetical protein